MNDRFSAKLRMYKLLLGTCNDFREVWKAILAFERNVLGLAAEVDSINKLNSGLQTNSSGHTQSKEESMEDMIFSALSVSYALRAYASANKMHELFADVNVERSDFTKIKESDRDDLALHIHDLGTQHLVGLADFGAAQPELDELGGRIENFSEKIGQPRTVITGLKMARSAQQQHFDNADKIIKEGLDNLIFPFQRKDPRFYEAYQNARYVIKAGGKTGDKPEGE